MHETIPVAETSTIPKKTVLTAAGTVPLGSGTALTAAGNVALQYMRNVPFLQQQELFL